MDSPLKRTVNPTVREARPEDAPQIRDFQVAMAFESEKLKLDPEVCLRGVLRLFSEPSLGGYQIVEAVTEGGQTETLGCVLIQREWSDWRARMVLWIHSLYVRPEFRGQGAYRAIYTALQTRVKSDPALAGLRLYVDKTNTPAIGVYEKLGMTREHYHLYEWMK